VARISGGDSGIGKSVAVHFAKEGADIAILYLEENEDADRTRTLVEREGRRCPLLRADVGERQASEGAIRRTLDALGKLDILVDIAAEQHVAKSFDDIPPEQLEQTFRTNLFGMFYRSSPSRDRYRCSSSKKVSASTRSRRVRFGRR